MPVERGEAWCRDSCEPVVGRMEMVGPLEVGGDGAVLWYGCRPRAMRGRGSREKRRRCCRLMSVRADGREGPGVQMSPVQDRSLLLRLRYFAEAAAGEQIVVVIMYAVSSEERKAERKGRNKEESERVEGTSLLPEPSPKALLLLLDNLLVELDIDAAVLAPRPTDVESLELCVLVRPVPTVERAEKSQPVLERRVRRAHLGREVDLAVGGAKGERTVEVGGEDEVDRSVLREDGDSGRCVERPLDLTARKLRGSQFGKAKARYKG